MTSYFAGLSLREIYEKKCVELHCRKNSAICHVLSDVPDEYKSLILIDLSKNFLGPKGILPLLEIVRCCRNIRTLDLREQQLDNEATDALCLALRQHPSIVRINLSDNPLTMNAGASLLQLVRDNPVIEFMMLDGTGIRNSIIQAIQSQLEQNRKLKEMVAELDLLVSPGSRDANNSSPGEDHGIGRVSPVQVIRAAAEAVKDGSNAISLEMAISAAMYEDNSDRKRLKAHDVEAALLSFSRKVHEFLYDDNPIPVIAQLCEQQYAWFYDQQFAADDVAVQHRATTQYSIAGWRRVGDIYPSARLFPGIDEEKRLVLPRHSPLSFSWIFVCVDAAFNDLESLQSTVLGSHSLGHGVYGLRVHIDGAWRYVVVDDLLPVNSKDELIFTHPVNGKYFWPCILEKALAKLHGGYSALDLASFDGARSKLMCRPERNNRFSINSRASTVLSLEGMNNPISQSTNERQTSFAKTLSDLSGGVGIARFLKHERFQADEWWLTMLELYGAGALMVALSGPANRTLSGIEPSHLYRILQVWQMNGTRLIELSSFWATTQWKGDWSEESAQWHRYRDVDAALRGQRSATRSFSFWISYTDFIAAFTQVHFCHLFQGFHQRVINDEWDRNSAGGSCYGNHWHLNPHYRLKITQESPFFINLAVPDIRFTTTDIDSLALHIVQHKQYPVRYGHDSENIVVATKYVLTDSLSFEGIIKGGDDYWVIPSSHTGGVMGKFLLRIFSQSGFIIWKEDSSYHWNTLTYSNTIENSGEYRTGEDNEQVVLSFTSNTNVGNLGSKTGSLVVKARAPDSEEIALGMFLVKTTLVEDKPSRSVGVLPEESIVAASPFIVDDAVYLEADVAPGERYTLVTCAHPAGSRARLEFTMWSSLPSPQLIPLPVWSKKTVTVSWPYGSGSYYEVTRNPQVEIYPARMLDTFVIRMQVVDCSYKDPAIVFFVLANDGRQGEGIKGQIPADRVVVRSQYVRHHVVQCELLITEPMDSLLVLPCLQPAGSFGECRISVATESGDFMIRVLSTD
ncbi:calpain-like cysteine peptidase [Trypanosoma conorhini]|uniref:Calpain-like cysteine peptidase n=1 Tax=Trypanosoma conorhini TaxID=83891 RepID=A0A3R7MKQ6_9TRYP|nr:calpain-like cysteine peptidase [Trypanosoma conorhini]RNF16762.1 calpain-like cysteine peptidase [Trypanosoma conorhini]